MLHVVYRLNLFGGKDARQQMRNKRPQGDGEGPGGMPPGGAPGGVRPMGSGRPMGGGF